MGRPDDAAVRQINAAMGAAISKARKAAKVTQKELGVAVGREQATVSDWEKGEAGISLPYIRAVGEVLGCGAGALFEAAGLTEAGDDLVDRIRRDTTIEDNRKEVIIEIVEASRKRLAGQLND